MDYDPFLIYAYQTRDKKIKEDPSFRSKDIHLICPLCNSTTVFEAKYTHTATDKHIRRLREYVLLNIDRIINERVKIK